MMQDSFKDRRDVIHKLLDGIIDDNSQKLEGAFYALCDVSGTGMDDIEFATEL